MNGRAIDPRDYQGKHPLTTEETNAAYSAKDNGYKELNLNTVRLRIEFATTTRFEDEAVKDSFVKKCRVEYTEKRGVYTVCLHRFGLQLILVGTVGFIKYCSSQIH